jgi:hypothetical protein
MKARFVAIAVVGATLSLASYPSAQAAPVAGGDAITRAAIAAAPLEDVAVRIFRGHRYCFSFDGWHGPGWYRCGWAWRRGLGWGGVYGWNNWYYAPAVTFFGHRHFRHGRLVRHDRFGTRSRFVSPNVRFRSRTAGVVRPGFGRPDRFGPSRRAFTSPNMRFGNRNVGTVRTGQFNRQERFGTNRGTFTSPNTRLGNRNFGPTRSAGFNGRVGGANRATFGGPAVGTGAGGRGGAAIGTGGMRGGGGATFRGGGGGTVGAGGGRAPAATTGSGPGGRQR